MSLLNYHKKRDLDSPNPIGKNNDTTKSSKEEFDPTNLETDPGKRISIWKYNPNIRDDVRRAYILKGPCQPILDDFPLTIFSDRKRCFNRAWFDEYKNWLEYSESKDSAFCLCCYLFKPNNGDQGGGDNFVVDGFRNWRKKDRLDVHVGTLNSAHNQAWSKLEDFRNQKQHIEHALVKQTDQAQSDYLLRLNASIDVVRFLLRQGLAFRGDDESDNSRNQGNFLELLRFLADHNDDISHVTLKNAPENLKLTAPSIQKEIVNAVVVETIDVIMRDIGDSFFCILVDESCDVSMKEQMAVVVRYVDKKGYVIERFIGIEHVTSTTAISLKEAIDNFFSRHGLSLSRLRGQGYDGASNMQTEFNGLKTLIMKENPCAFYIHCFSHQLQLALVAVAKKHIQVASLFHSISSIVNISSASAKRCDALHQIQARKIFEAINNGDICTGKGLNQETMLTRTSDTRWSSHYDSLISLITMFSATIDLLEIIVDEGSSSKQRFEANNLLSLMQSFDFVFTLHLMKAILGITNELSKALQRKDQDIVNAMTLEKICKQRLQTMRAEGWKNFYDVVSSFCGRHNIEIPNMNDVYIALGRSRRKVQEVNNLHHYRVELFYSVIDMQLMELNDRFTEANTELLLCVACLCPTDTFSSYDKQKLIRLAELYPNDFSATSRLKLEDQLDTYICDVCSSIEFVDLKALGDLAKKMVETKKDQVYPLVYLLIALALVLPVATATVERVFSGMKIVKNRLRNRMGDSFMNDCLIAYIEKDIFDSIGKDAIILRFQNMKPRRIH